jgi:hypothetical protein
MSDGGFEKVTGRIMKKTDKNGKTIWSLSYSDDVLTSSSSSDRFLPLNDAINKQFKIEIEEELPKKWVGMDLNVSDENIMVSGQSTLQSYGLEPSRYPLSLFNKLKLDNKSSNKSAVHEALCPVGRLIYAANTNPYLSFPGAFLASAAHYDPAGAADLADNAMAYYAQNAVHIPFTGITPKYIVIHTDASFNVIRRRGYAGCWIQLQETENIERRHDPVTWACEKYVELDASVYAGEAMAIQKSLEAIHKVLPTLEKVWGKLPIILYCDNEAVVGTINDGTKEPHPFTTTIFDFIKQELVRLNIDVRHVPSKLNLADCLTKPSKPVETTDAELDQANRKVQKYRRATILEGDIFPEKEVVDRFERM